MDLHVTADVTLRIRHLRGRFEPTARAVMPFLEDKLSYVVAIDSGEIALDMASLNALMTRTLGQGRSNVEKLRISTDDQSRLRQQGVLKKGIKVPFDVKGGVEATPDGRIRMHAAAVRGFGLPVNPLMKLLGLKMDDLLKVKPGHGVTVDNNDLILDPAATGAAPADARQSDLGSRRGGCDRADLRIGRTTKALAARRLTKLYLLARWKAAVWEAHDDRDRPRAG